MDQEAVAKAAVVAEDDASIDAFDPTQFEVPGSSNDAVAAIAASKAHATSKAQPPSKRAVKCKACGMDSEFVADGMIPCDKCSGALYCSVDCREWDWTSAGHQNECKGWSGSRREETVPHSQADNTDDLSIEPFESSSQSQPGRHGSAAGMLVALRASKESASKTSLASKEEAGSQAESPALHVICQACGMEEEFVEDGMEQCPHCLRVAYCSEECMEWDWISGGHKELCSGYQESVTESSVQSVLSSTLSAENDGTVTSAGAVICSACGMESEYVPEGMLSCACNQVMYCSGDCKEWHWGVHKKDCSAQTLGGGVAAGAAAAVVTAAVVVAADESSVEPFDPQESEMTAPGESSIAAAVVAPEVMLAAKTEVVSDDSSVAPSESNEGEMEVPTAAASTVPPPPSTNSISKENTPPDSVKSASAKPSKSTGPLQVKTFDYDETQEATPRFQTYRDYLAEAVAEVMPWVERVGSSVKWSSYLGVDEKSSSIAKDIEIGSSSGSESTGLASADGMDSDDDSQLSSRLQSYLSNNVSGAVQLAAPTDDGELPTFIDSSTAGSGPPSEFIVGEDKPNYNSSNALAKTGEHENGLVLAPLSEVKTQLPGPPSDIENGKSGNLAVLEEVAETRKKYRNRCIISNIVILIVAICISVGITIQFLGRSDDGDEEVSTPESPVPTILLPPSTSPTTAVPLPPISVPPTTSSTTSPSSLPLPLPPASAPPASPAPTAFDPLDDLFNFLVSQSFDNGTALSDAGSPQSQAFEWLLTDPRLEEYSADRLIQRYSMATFYYSTGGDSWEENTLWLSEENECTWFSRSSSFPVCASNEIVTLELDFNNLEGTIPAEMALLSKLERVELSGGPDVYLSASLPTEVGLLTDLNSFSIRGNHLSNEVPTELGKLAMLETLNLSLNRFKGFIPSELGALASLNELFLGSNELTGPLPTEIGQATKLFRISLGTNRLSGDLPTQIGALSELRYIYMESNKLSSLPSEVGLLSNLIVMAIFENSMAGLLPSEIGELSELRSLLLGSNSFSSSIPSELGMLGRQLGNLDLSFNNFNGPLPSELGRMAFLRTLELQNNMLTGTVPTTLAALGRLNTIRIDSNDLTGEVPLPVCESYSASMPLFYADCPDQIQCDCCTYCCTNDVCTCVHAGTDLEFLC